LSEGLPEDKKWRLLSPDESAYHMYITDFSGDGLNPSFEKIEVKTAILEVREPANPVKSRCHFKESSF
jgi:hypothetical protein